MIYCSRCASAYGFPLTDVKVAGTCEICYTHTSASMNETPIEKLVSQNINNEVFETSSFIVTQLSNFIPNPISMKSIYGTTDYKVIAPNLVLFQLGMTPGGKREFVLANPKSGERIQIIVG
jgi:hypothetical protein